MYRAAVAYDTIAIDPRLCAMKQIACGWEVGRLKITELADYLRTVVRVVRGGTSIADVTSVIFFDPADVDAVGPGSLVIVVGVADEASARPVLAEIEARGASGVVFRPGVWRQAPPATWAAAVLERRPGTTWDDTVPLIQAAVQASGTSVPGVTGGSDMFDLADVVACAAGGAVLIEDSERNILAYSTVEGQQIDALRQDGILRRRVPQTELTYEGYRDVMQSPTPVRFPARGSRQGRVAVALRASSEILGSIWVVDIDGSVSDESLKLLSDVAAVAAFRILRERSQQLATGSPATMQTAQLLHGSADFATRTAWEKAAPTTVVVAMTCAGEPMDALAWASRAQSSTATYLGAFRREQAVLAEEHRLYLLIAVRDDAEDEVRRLVRGAVDHLERSLGKSVIAAIGPPVASASVISKSRELADELLALLVERRELANIATYATLASSLQLRRIASGGDARVLLDDPRLARLLAEDESGQYVSTLRAYLDCLGDTARAGTVCNVHSNTIRYRVQKIQQLLDVDLRDPDDRLVLWLQMRLL